MRKLIEKYRDKVKPFLVATAMITVVTGAVYNIGYMVSKDIEFSNVYNSALERYADQNHDHIITQAEIDAFDVSLFKKKNIIYRTDHFPKYRTGKNTGKTVPIETVIEWIKDYKPPQETKEPITFYNIDPIKNNFKKNK